MTCPRTEKFEEETFFDWGEGMFVVRTKTFREVRKPGDNSTLMKRVDVKQHVATRLFLRQR